MCAPLVPPCPASYIDALTRTSSSISGEGVGIACPIARYTEALLCCTPPAPALPTPVLFTTRAEATWLVLFPLNRLLASTPFNRNELLVSLCPLAQIGWLPKPELAPVPPDNSAFTPGDRIASPVKLPVGNGVASICAFSRT